MRLGWMKNNDCDADYCKNGGTCFSNKNQEKTCSCATDYTGDHCEIFIGKIIVKYYISGWRMLY